MILEKISLLEEEKITNSGFRNDLKFIYVFILLLMYLFTFVQKKKKKDKNISSVIYAGICRKCTKRKIWVTAGSE